MTEWTPDLPGRFEDCLPEPVPAQRLTPLPWIDAVTAPALAQEEHAPLRWILPGLLPEGLCLFAGREKGGKSFMALQIALAVATGGRALDTVEIDEPGSVLMLALEDSRRRLKERLEKLAAGRALPETLELGTVAPEIGDELLEGFAAWRKTRTNPRLIVIDVLRAVKPPSGSRSGYDEDARTLAPLLNWVRERPGVGIMVLHHTNKATWADPFDGISGTRGLSGVPDSLWVLVQGETLDAPWKLQGRGRDLEPFAKELQRLPDGGWRIAGDATATAKTSERTDILRLLKDKGQPMGTGEIAEALGKANSTISEQLRRMAKAGEVVGSGYGMWALPA
ncbi:MAG: AAA family ATPase [Sphingomonadaceae bacterium]